MDWFPTGSRRKMPAQIIEIDPAPLERSGSWTQGASLMSSRSVSRPTAVERFIEKVDLTGPEDSCWQWTACLVRGYGQFAVGQRKRAKAHRFSYEMLVGPVPEGLVLDHLCRNPECVNPAHLEPVSERKNILRGVGPTAVNAARTHCIYGHEFTPENTYIRPNRPTERECRVCKRRRKREEGRK